MTSNGILGDVQPVLRGTLMFPLPGADHEGVYTDENEVNWFLASRPGADLRMEYIAWIDGDDAKAVYGLADDMDKSHPGVERASSPADAAAKVDGWIAAKGKLNPKWQATQAQIQALTERGKPTVHQADLGTQGLGLWGWLAAVVGLYLISDYADRGKRRRK